MHELADSKQVTPIWVIDEAQNLPPEFFRDFPRRLTIGGVAHGARPATDNALVPGFARRDRNLTEMGHVTEFGLDQLVTVSLEIRGT